MAGFPRQFAEGPAKYGLPPSPRRYFYSVFFFAGLVKSRGCSRGFSLELLLICDVLKKRFRIVSARRPTFRIHDFSTMIILGTVIVSFLVPTIVSRNVLGCIQTFELRWKSFDSESTPNILLLDRQLSREIWFFFTFFVSQETWVMNSLFTLSKHVSLEIPAM